MAKSKGALSVLWNLIAWVTGVLVALAVGSGMVNGILTVAYIPDTLTVLAGWVVVILTLLGVLLAVIDKLSK